MIYRSLAAHNVACNWIFHKLQDCYEEHPYRKFLGYCEHIGREMDKCIKEQREIHRQESAQFRHRRLGKQETLHKESSD